MPLWKRTAVASAIAAVMLAVAPPAIAQSVPYEIEEVAIVPVHPWSLAFLPDGDLLVTVRSGQLLRLAPDGTILTNYRGVPQVFEQAQAGLFDVVLHPDFEENGYIYLSYAAGSAEANATHLARARLGEEGLEDFELLFYAEPLKDTAVHYGGRIVFLPDNSLLLTLGDGFDYREEAQNLGNHLGTIVHLNDDGTLPAGNPFADLSDARPEIWTYGHRNPQGLARDPVTGTIYETEHGPQGGDEVNVITPGTNYGWPIATYGLDYTSQLVTPYAEYPGMEGPVHTWVPSIAPSGLAVYRGPMFPEWDGDLLAGALIAGDAPAPISGHVRRVDMEDGAAVSEEILFPEIGERVRDVRVAPDGSIYVLTDASNAGMFEGEATETNRILRVFRSE